ncbi:MAG: SCP2 sterol-binding domain-containing protein [Gallionella sp.]
MFALPSAAALNHLLAQNSWAQPRLLRYAGKTVRFHIAPFSFAFLVLSDGSLQATDKAATADAILHIAPSLLPRLLAKDDSALNGIISSGDSALLADLFYLSRNLRWDAAEDLSKVTGDIAAERIVSTVQDAHAQLGDAALNLSQAAAEYWTEERPLLATPVRLANFAASVDILRDDIARLSLRVQRLTEKKVK